jgi:membrane-associated protease RseP (regulator of RpoE activity)
MDPVAREVEHVRSVVGRYFPTYDARLHGDVLIVFVNVDASSVGERFDLLRRELMPQGYIPLIVHEGGEFMIYIRKRSKTRFRGPRLNAVLLGVTLFTTVLSGMSLWAGYVGIQDYTGEFWRPAVALNGALFFALPLLAILGTHEMSHYLAARRHGVAASLPFFLPAPPIIGTFGALISMRDPIPNQKALVDIGISGPLGGLAVAIPVTALGFHLSAISPGFQTTNIGGGLEIGIPLLYELISQMVPAGPGFLHPTAFAGWVGLFVTALNLLPAGQLDGGHVARALLGEKGRYLSYATIAIMLGLSYFYLGWVFLAIFILLLGPRHPPPLNDITRLPVNRKLLGSTAAIVMALCFVAVPFQEIEVERGFIYTLPEEPEVAVQNLTVTVESEANATFILRNVGNVRLVINLTLGTNAMALVTQEGWTILFVSAGSQSVWDTSAPVSVNATEALEVRLWIAPDPSAPPPGPFTVDVVGRVEEDPALEAILQLNVLLA